MAVDLLARVRAEIDGRLAELRPSVAEYERLLGAAGALDDEVQAPAGKPRAAAKPRQAAARTPAAPKPSEATRPPAAAKPRVAAKPRGASRPRQTRMGASEQAIVAALEHGSHTVGELGVVTAMSGPQIRDSLRRLLKAGKIARARREGRAAYELADSA